MKNLNPPHDLNEFFTWLKAESEKLWGEKEIDGGMYGFQFQKGTKWLDGLTDDEIAEYEHEIGFKFPEIYKIYLRNMNGTDKQAINVYGESGEPYQHMVGFYSYPRDLEIVKDRINWILESFNITSDDLEQKEIPHIMPILFHRFLVMDRCDRNPVLSMYGEDVILYASSLRNLVLYDIFHEWDSKKVFANFEVETEKQDQLLGLKELPANFKVKFWLE